MKKNNRKNNTRNNEIFDRQVVYVTESELDSLAPAPRSSGSCAAAAAAPLTVVISQSDLNHIKEVDAAQQTLKQFRLGLFEKFLEQSAKIRGAEDVKVEIFEHEGICIVSVGYWERSVHISWPITKHSTEWTSARDFKYNRTFMKVYGCRASAINRLATWEIDVTGDEFSLAFFPRENASYTPQYLRCLQYH